MIGISKIMIIFGIILTTILYWASSNVCRYNFAIEKKSNILNIISNEEKSRPLKYYEAILFQFVNPKAWVICITAVSLFYPEKENLIIGTIFMVIMSTIINIPSISIWAFGGSVIRHYLTNNKYNITFL